ncbi:MAG: TRAP transporter TatT component family protein [Pseudomonadota bacterium]
MKKMATTTIGKIATDGSVVLEKEQDVDLARNSTPSLILTLEVLSAGNPKDKRLLTLLAKAYGQYAFGFLEEDLLQYKHGDRPAYQKSYDRANLFYKKGKAYGLNALWYGDKQEKILILPQAEFEKELMKFGRKDVPALFWTAFCWGNWINLHRDDPMTFVDLPRATAIMERVLELDPGFYYGSVHSYLGAIAGSRPKMLGGNPELAQKEFQAASQAAPDYLMHKVLYAQYYAVQVQDKALFESLLEEVQDVDLSGLKQEDMRLANELAKRRAELLLERSDNYF